MKTVQANELRLGNYLYGVITPRIVKVISKDYYTDEHDNSTLIRDAKPIQLTEDILLKCGFERIRNNYIIKVDDFLWFGLDYEDYSLFIRDKYGKDEIVPTRYIDSLHQLQNLYFALTGEELNINF